MVPYRHSLIFLATLGLLAGCDNSATPDKQTDAPTPTVTESESNTRAHDQSSAEASSAEKESAEQAAAGQPTADPGTDALPFSVSEVTQFDSPWAMTFLPDGRLLVTEMAGTLRLHDLAGERSGTIGGVPEVVHAGQGGLGDVLLHPQFETNQHIYLSYAEAGDGGAGAAVARARLVLDDEGSGKLEDLDVIWRQTPKLSGNGHFGHRLAFDSDGMLWISSSERQAFDPSQDMNSNLGKVVRLNDDGSVPEDNPFTDQGEIAAQVWSLGHRNILGMAFDSSGKLWAHEMGPEGGDELNLIEKGANYGYPLVSNGNHYDGTSIPDHDTRPEFKTPAITWTPVISPAGFIIYDGELFADWQGSGFIGGMSSLSLVRVEFDGEKAHEAERFDMQKRIREVEQGPDGAIWLLEDGMRGGDGQLLKLTPSE
ncbi:Glucose/arabinose dehydrogenase, beta-propeller fold [Halopseudomonas litoralis]|uniref:Glucose/arabinose dehydrogenase, beta-propeller fold n=1 Tax=Halopseudomonas litoralis TaxID=797277 RepID=A0A1H1Y6F0_9GAMM|nr:PQQ-dependent sugar dehydrogenase [Halopseudomonas litoralis]SDT16981.1 Glucose/arabinose dehydrogenase, beta-propeller fold [Halopseudomonas litoralis]